MRSDVSYDQSPIVTNELMILRRKSHLQVRDELNTRLRSNPHPSAEEYRLGSFIEALEPQVRDAVRMLNRKGYPTCSSGFSGVGESQQIDGPLGLDEKIKTVLEQTGCVVDINNNGYTFIRFKPITANISDIKAKWDEIAELLPDKGHSAHPSMTNGAVSFRKNYQELPTS